MSLRWWLGVPLGLFAAGIAVGRVADKANIPSDQVNRWLVKQAMRKALNAYDFGLEILPHDEPLRLTEALAPDRGSLAHGASRI